MACASVIPKGASSQLTQPVGPPMAWATPAAYTCQESCHSPGVHCPCLWYVVHTTDMRNAFIAQIYSPPQAPGGSLLLMSDVCCSHLWYVLHVCLSSLPVVCCSCTRHMEEYGPWAAGRCCSFSRYPGLDSVREDARFADIRHGPHTSGMDNTRQTPAEYKCGQSPTNPPQT